MNRIVFRTYFRQKQNSMYLEYQFTINDNNDVRLKLTS